MGDHSPGFRVTAKGQQGDWYGGLCGGAYLQREPGMGGYGLRALGRGPWAKRQGRKGEGDTVGWQGLGDRGGQPIRKKAATSDKV